jgi:hypothetical protein
MNTLFLVGRIQTTSYVLRQNYTIESMPFTCPSRASSGDS